MNSETLAFIAGIVWLWLNITGHGGETAYLVGWAFWLLLIFF